MTDSQLVEKVVRALVAGDTAVLTKDQQERAIARILRALGKNLEDDAPGAQAAVATDDPIAVVLHAVEADPDGTGIFGGTPLSNRRLATALRYLMKKAKT